MRTLLIHADLHTMCPGAPRAQAAVLSDDRFVYVGTEEGARLYLGGAPDAVIDAQGMTVIPGLNDAHLHYAHTALRETVLDLTDAASIAQVQAMLRARLAVPDRGWIIAEGWNQEQFAEGRILTRADLDAVGGDLPILAARACGHIAVANSRALQMAGCDVSDGILREDEQGAVWACIPPRPLTSVIDAMVRKERSLFAKGITSVQSDDLGVVADGEEGAFLYALRDACGAGRLRVRYAEQALCPEEKAIATFFEQGCDRLRADNFRVSCIKLLADGSLGARTAWLCTPYHDAPETSGIATYDDETMRALVRMSVLGGLPVAVHAIGDGAMGQVLDALEAEGAGLRHAIVHAQIMDAKQLRRCGEMGLAILAQPIFLRADVPIVQGRVGADLAATSYRWRTMRGIGAHVALSTDCPVEPFDPMPNLYCAMTRKGSPEMAPYLPEEAFTLDEALYAYTAAGAYASGEEADKGRIAPGMLADFVILNRKLDEREPEAILETGVAATYVGGACVYSA